MCALGWELEGNSRLCFPGSPGEGQRSGRRSCTGGGDGFPSLSPSPPGGRSLSGCKSRGEARSGCERCSSPPGCRGGWEGREVPGGAQVRAADGHPAPGLGPGIAWCPERLCPALPGSLASRETRSGGFSPSRQVGEGRAVPPPHGHRASDFSEKRHAWCLGRSCGSSSRSLFC